MTANLAEITALLTRTPACLRALCEGLPDVWLDTREREGTFSPRDVLGHLIHGERTDWLTRARTILSSGESQPFAPFDRFGFREARGDASAEALLVEFEQLRRRNLDELGALALTPAQLALRGRHPEFGPVTLLELLSTWAVHDLNHLGQIARVMALRYQDAVGPWRAYLGILQPR